jgi:hypothetical protein
MPTPPKPSRSEERAARTAVREALNQPPPGPGAIETLVQAWTGPRLTREQVKAAIQAERARLSERGWD